MKVILQKNNFPLGGRLSYFSLSEAAAASTVRLWDKSRQQKNKIRAICRKGKNNAAIVSLH